jgi:hypothetical protein
VIHLGAGEPKNKAPINALLQSAAKLTAGDIEELVSNLDDLTVNVEGKETVRIYAE